MRAFLAYRQLEAIVDEIDENRPEPARQAEIERQLAAARTALAEPAAGLLGDHGEALRLLVDLEWLFAQWAPAGPVIDLAAERARRRE
jgi:hypothetical protein